MEYKLCRLFPINEVVIHRKRITLCISFSRYIKEKMLFDICF